VRDVRIAAAQMACSRDIKDNTAKIVDYIGRAAAERADVVVFPELAVTGQRKEDVLAADAAALDAALAAIAQEAKARQVYAIVGTPYVVDGARRNGAVVIGDDGTVLTRYAEVATRPGGAFSPGTDLGAMWFTLKGVHAIVTVGGDADWIEIGDLAANRGMCLHFHISCEADASGDSAIVRRQRNLVGLMFAQYGAVVNAADPTGLRRPSSPASGGSVIVSREGAHNKAAPEGLEYYLPYHTCVVKSAGTGETMICATRKTAARNPLDLEKLWRNRERKARPQSGWYEWIKQGALLVSGNAGE